MAGLFFGVAAFVFGTVIGSFLNVCIYRLPRGESLVYPPSHCPLCYRPIRMEDNIPVLSWFLLAGRCRDCAGRISVIYPVVEFLTGALFFTYYWQLVGFYQQPTPGQVGFYAIHMAFVSALLAAAVIDFKHLIIPDEISVPGIVLGLAASFVFPQMHAGTLVWGHPHVSSLAESAIGALAGAAVVYAIGAAGKVAMRREAMGFGDVKLMAMIGAFLGWEMTIFVLFMSAVIALAYGLVQMAFTGSNKIPYGPFLSIAAALGLLFRPAIDTFIAEVIKSYTLLL